LADSRHIQVHGKTITYAISQERTMRAHSGSRAAGGERKHASDSAEPNYGRLSRAALLAGASAFALVALGAPARAACVPSPQIINVPASGPIFSNGGAITVTGSGSIEGDPDGVDAVTCPISTLTNQSGGTINGGAGAGGFLAGGAGGVGVSNARTIETMTNGGAISGGRGGSAFSRGGVGGAGLSNAGTITTLTNNGKMSGGSGGGGAERGGAGGEGLWDAEGATITTLTNSGKIAGGSGGLAFGGPVGGGGGVGVWNAQDVVIGSLINQATGLISGGRGGRGVFGATGGVGVLNAGRITSVTNKGVISGGSGDRNYYSGGAGGAGLWNVGTITTVSDSGAISGGSGGSGSRGGAGGVGVSNAGTIATLTNSGAISGGTGGGGSFGHGGAGGAGVSNAGTIGTLTNSGAISAGNGGAGRVSGSAGDAITSSGSIGPITNRGEIIGNVEIDNQASVTVTGGVGTTFGQWTEGAITIGNGNLTFAGGNTSLADNVSANGGLGMVTNEGVLQLNGPQSIKGSFAQTGAGVLDLGIAGNASGQYGALQISAAASLDGGLGLDLLSGFSLSVGDKFDVLSFTSSSGGFDALSLGGTACAAQAADVWRCYAGSQSWYLTETIGGAGLYQQYVSVTAEAPAPEPGTSALLAMGFAWLAGWRWRMRAGARSSGA
jgi:hypothetical protein